MTPSHHPAAQRAIVADDLTGACDAGVHFLKLGCDVTVTLDLQSIPTDTGLAVIATHTRNESPPTAADAVRQAARRLASSGRQVFYKKMDSTLHGNPGAEIDALLDIGPAHSALVCPAFPDMGRRYHLGELLLGAERRRTGRNVTARLREQTVRRIVHLTIEEVWSAGLPDRIRQDLQREPALVVCDAESEADVRRVAELALELDRLVLPCGSTGLARQLATVLAGAAPLPATSPFRSTALAPEEGRPQRPCVGVIGSTSPVTQEQMQHAVARRQARVLAIRDLTPSTLEAALKDPRPLFLTWRLDSPGPDRLPSLAEILRRLPPSGLLLSGGDTAWRFCATAGITGIRLGGEIETGIPWGRIFGGRMHELLVATKAGGFGTASALVDCADFFSRHQG